MTVTVVKNRKALGGTQYHEDIGLSQWNAGVTVDGEQYNHKDYKAVLFRDGQAVQIREWNTLQTIFAESLKDGRDLEFKNGSVVTGMLCTIVENESGTDYTANFTAGIVYWDGAFHRVDAFAVNFDGADMVQFGDEDFKQFNVCLEPKYETVDVYTDTKLGDPAILYRTNETLRGADRLRLTFDAVEQTITYDSANVQFLVDETWASDHRQAFPVATIESDAAYTAFDVRHRNRIYSASDTDKTSEETSIKFGLRVKPLNGLEAYIFGGTGEKQTMKDVTIEENTIGAYETATPFGDTEPFAVQVTEGAGKLEGNDVVNARTRTFFFDKKLSSQDTAQVDEVLRPTHPNRAFLGVPFQMFAFNHLGKETATYPDYMKQRTSMITPSNMEYFDRAVKIDSSETERVDWSGAAVAYRYLKPGTKVRFVATNFDSAGGSAVDNADHAWDTELASAYVCATLPMGYYLNPMSLDDDTSTNATGFFMEPLDFLKYILDPNNVDKPTHYKVSVVYAVYYHRIVFANSSNFGNLLEPGTYTLDITDGTSDLDGAFVTEVDVRLVVQPPDGSAEYDVWIDLKTDANAIFDGASYDTLANSLSWFHVTPSVNGLTEDEQKEIYRLYPEKLTAPFAKLTYPYAIGGDNAAVALEIPTAMDFTAKITQRDADAAFDAEIVVDGTDPNNPTDLSDKVIRVTAIKGESTVVGRKIAWQASNLDETVARDDTTGVSQRTGENIIHNRVAGALHSIEFPARNIEAYANFKLTLTFASGGGNSAEENRDAAKAFLAANFGGFVIAAGTGMGAAPLSLTAGPLTTTWVVDADPVFTVKIGRIYDWTDGRDVSLLDVECSQVQCMQYIVAQYIFSEWTSLNMALATPMFVPLFAANDVVYLYSAKLSDADPDHDAFITGGVARGATVASYQMDTSWQTGPGADAGPFRGTHYSEIREVDGGDYTYNVMTPILPHSELFVYTMPKPLSQVGADNETLCALNLGGIDTRISCIGLKSHDGNANLIAHSLRFDTAEDLLGWNGPREVPIGFLGIMAPMFDHKFGDQLYKLKEAYGSYFEEIADTNGYHIVDDFSLSLNLESAIDPAILAELEALAPNGIGVDPKTDAYLRQLLTTNRGYAKISYDVYQPITVHFYADDENEIYPVQTLPSMVFDAKASELGGVLYLGSTHVPPYGFWGFEADALDFSSAIIQGAIDRVGQLDSEKGLSLAQLASVFGPDRRSFEYELTASFNSGTVMSAWTGVLRHVCGNASVLDTHQRLTPLKAPYVWFYKQPAREDLTTLNHGTAALNVDGSIIEPEFIDTHIHFDSSNGAWTPEVDKFTPYNYNGRTWLTLKSIGEEMTVATGGIEDYSETLDASIDSAADRDFLRLREMPLRDRESYAGYKLADKSTKLYDTAAINQFGWLVEPRRKFCSADVAMVRHQGVPLSRTTFIDQTKTSSKQTKFQAVETPTAIAFARNWYRPAALFAPFTNNVIAKEMYRESFDPTSDSWMNRGFEVFGWYPTPFEVAVRLYTDELTSDAIPTTMNMVSMRFDGIPVWPCWADSMDPTVPAPTTDWLDLWSSFCWYQNQGKTVNFFSDGTSDFLQSFIQAGCHSHGFEIEWVDGTNTHLEQHGRHMNLGSEWGRTDRLCSHIFENTADAVLCKYAIVDTGTNEITLPSIFGSFVRKDGNMFLTWETSIAGTHTVPAIFDRLNAMQSNDAYTMPRVAQAFKFSEPRMLKRIAIHVDTDPWESTQILDGPLISNLDEPVAVHFGFLINGKIDPNGFTHTEFVYRDQLVDGRLMVDTSLPIHIPANVEFFVALSHVRRTWVVGETTYQAPAMEVKLIANGGYSLGDQYMTPFPADFDSVILIDGERFTDRMLKMDMWCHVYNVDAATVESSNILDRSATLGAKSPDRVVRYLYLEKDVAPEGTLIEYYGRHYTAEDRAYYEAFEPGKEVALDRPANKLGFKLSASTYDRRVSPILKLGNAVGVYTFEPVTATVSAISKPIRPAEAGTKAPTDIIDYRSGSNTFTKLNPEITDALTEVTNALASGKSPFLTTVTDFEQYIADNSLVETVDGSVIEIAIDNAISKKKWMDYRYANLHTGPSLSKYNKVTLNAVQYYYYTTQGALFRMQFDFYDKDMNATTTTKKALPVGLYYKSAANKSPQQLVFEAESFDANDEAEYYPTVAFPTIYEKDGDQFVTMGWTSDVRDLGGGWWRQTVEAIPFAPRPAKDFSLPSSYDEVEAILPTDPSLWIPKPIFPLENYQFIVKIGLPRGTGPASAVRNVKTSFDSMVIHSAVSTKSLIYS
jgi:hypothetical protein